MWNDMTHMGISVGDKVIRTLVVYLLLAVLIRLAGKRDLAQLNAFDLVVVLLLSNVVQNAVIGPDNSLLGGSIGAIVLIAFNSFVVRGARRSTRLATALEGTSTVLASDGQWNEEALRKEGLRKADADAAIRRQGANNVHEVKEVSIEPGGAIVTTLKDKLQSANAGDLARVEAKIDLLLARVGD